MRSCSVTYHGELTEAHTGAHIFGNVDREVRDHPEPLWRKESITKGKKNVISTKRVCNGIGVALTAMLIKNVATVQPIWRGGPSFSS